MDINQMKNIRVPMISLDRKASPDLTSVTVNNREGARQAVGYLKKIGCRRIAHLAGPENVSSARDRKKGYLDEVKEETWFTERYIRNGKYTIEQAFKDTQKLLKENPEIDGIFAANDLMAIGVLKAAAEMHIDIPNELSVVSFDGINMGEITTPALTTMAQPIYQIGKRAAEILIKKIENPETMIESEVHHVQLVIRETTKEGS